MAYNLIVIIKILQDLLQFKYNVCLSYSDFYVNLKINNNFK